MRTSEHPALGFKIFPRKKRKASNRVSEEDPLLECQDILDQQLDLGRLCQKEEEGPMCATLGRSHIGKAHIGGLIEDN